MKKQAPLYTVVFPCLNEEETIANALIQTKEVLKMADLELLVVDNGSSDNTASIARKHGARVVREEVPGYGSALMRGFREAGGTYVLYADPDGSYDLRYLPDMLEELRKGTEVVIATRLGGTITPGAMPWLHRYIGTPCLTFLIRVLYRGELTDCNSGMRGFKKECFPLEFLEKTGMEFASEVSILPMVCGLRTKEIPIHFLKDQRSREPHLRTFRDGFRHLWCILSYYPRSLHIRRKAR